MPKKKSPAKNRLINRDMIDILESYLGDSACYFEWIDKGFVKSIPIGKNQANQSAKDNLPAQDKHMQVGINVALREYPSDTAKIVCYLTGFSGYGGTPAFAEVPLSDPNGMEFIRKKVAAAIFMWKSVTPELE